jgi:hypothetical protein
MQFGGPNRELNRTEPIEPVLACSVPVPVQFRPRAISSVLGSPKKVGELD